MSYEPLILKGEGVDYCSESCEVHVVVNAFDHMIFFEVVALPDETVAAEAALLSLCKDVESLFGGKCLIKVSEKYRKIFEEFQFHSEGLQRGSQAKSRQFSLRQERPKISSYAHQQIDKIGQLGGYRLLIRHEDYFDQLEVIPDLFKQLSLFKKENAPFVTPQKIEQGLFSPEAERAKIENDNNRVFTLMEGDRIVATLMATFHADMVYIADCIVAQEKRSQRRGDPNGGLGQALFDTAIRYFQEETVGIETVWYVSGSDENSAMEISIHKINTAKLRTGLNNTHDH